MADDYSYEFDHFDDVGSTGILITPGSSVDEEINGRSSTFFLRSSGCPSSSFPEKKAEGTRLERMSSLAAYSWAEGVVPFSAVPLRRHPRAMPPRKRPAPPPEAPSPASKLHSEVNSKEPPPDDSSPKISAEIVKYLPATERKVYELIFAAGGKGMWTLDVRNATGMTPATATKILRSLVNKKLLKEVSDVRHRSKKIFMATEFQPSTEITGGTWYHDGRLDTESVAAARRCCLSPRSRSWASRRRI
ncbi:hypothetical protein PR202_ga15005 [Eleusine coracana subsp. coracana]|uniref:Uncharacterized protein n=1 Tax=Eleusine coracana subsp. coracana TaxID=191504 RepID=A0AAV5CJ81_ELECO|nr:hypothetical protein PR202_ga15005 [Eleusine coracana subsp. coracana]